MLYEVITFCVSSNGLGVPAHLDEIAARARELKPDLIIGNSKGYRVLSKELEVPMLRVGFPIHDRFGSQRVQHLCYAGTQALYDRIVNAVIDKKQTDSDIGYGYI